MRTLDRTPPALTPHTFGPDAPLAKFKWRPVIALERLPTAAYTWDDENPDVTWDDTTPTRVWDAATTAVGFTDASCDWMALQIEPGLPDEQGLFGATEATLTLDNRSGEYTPWSVDGRLVYWAPGRELAIWALDPGSNPWWMFRGRVTDWEINPDDTVTVTAFDGIAELAQRFVPPSPDTKGATWTPGTAGQLPGPRITAVASQASYSDPLRVDQGNNTLSTGPVDMAPLEAIQQAAWSDGGVFYSDADGTLVYEDRLWRAGRSDQTVVRAFSDNVCGTGAIIVWDPELAAADDRLATQVQLVNAADPALTATASIDPTSIWWSGRDYRLTHPDVDLWQTQVDGDVLAGYLVAQLSKPSMSVRSFGLYLFDPNQDLWQAGIDVRRGDKFEWVHEYPAPGGGEGLLDVMLVVTGVRHELTPEDWVVTVHGTRTVDYVTLEYWDETRYRWDDVPGAVWRY